MVDFATLLGKKVDDAKAPAPLPEGTFGGLIQKFEYKKSRDKGYMHVDFTIRLTDAKEDVDQAELAEIDISQRVLHKTFFFDQEGLEWAARSEAELGEFLKSLGIDTAGRTFNETIPETINAAVIVKVTHRLDPRNPERKLVDLSEIAGA